jgi:hypothetical protein
MILMDQVVCKLLCKKKAIISKISQFGPEETMSEFG